MKSQLIFRATTLAADLASVAASLRLAAWALGRLSGAPRVPWAAWWPVLALVEATWLVLFFGLRLYRFRGGVRCQSFESSPFLGTGILLTLAPAFAFAHRIRGSRGVLAVFALLFFLGAVASRLLLTRLLRRAYRSGRTTRTVILGDGPLAQEALRRVAREPELCWDVVGFLSPQSSAQERNNKTPLRTLELLDFAQSQRIDQVLVAVEQPNAPEIRKLVEQLRARGVRIVQVPAQIELYACRLRLFDLNGLPAICFDDLRPSRVELVAKRCFDTAGAAILLLVTAPLWGMLGVAARLRSGRAFARLRRAGRRGVPFEMYRLNLQQIGGRFSFRHSGISELPQLFNVLRGEMSLVGPRPESLEIARHYTERQRTRLEVMPGITGLAQVNGIRGELPRAERYNFDLEYVVGRTYRIDLAMLLRTLPALVARNRWNRTQPPADARADSTLDGRALQGGE